MARLIWVEIVKCAVHLILDKFIEKQYREKELEEDRKIVVVVNVNEKGW